MASADAPHQATWALYRIGWYGGSGARKVAEGGPFDVGPQPACPMDPATGSVSCAWSPSFSVILAGDFVSGLYLVKLVRDDGFNRFVPLVVVDDRQADLLLEASVNTAQAYNEWGGASLYADLTNTLKYHRALAVSFDRPYRAGRGAQSLAGDEIRFIRFLERHGYDVSYTTNADVSALGWRHLYRAGAFLSVGHDEYWTGEERDAVEEARDRGVPLLFFGANAAYWKVRYDAPASSNPRQLTCYKGPSLDPVQDGNVTGRFRDLGRPENALMGVMYDDFMRLSFPWVVTAPDNWLYAGTGLVAGDTLPGLVFHEFDRTFANGAGPPGLEVLAHSPVVNAVGAPSAAEATAYRTDAGTLVFAAGTLGWARALGPGAPDPRIDRMTANALREAIGLAIPTTLDGPAPPAAPAAAGPFAASVATLASELMRPTGVAPLADGSVVVSDPSGFVYRVVPASRRAAALLTGIAGGGDLEAPQGAPGTRVKLRGPTGIAADAAGDIYVADTRGHAILRIAGDASHRVATVAGLPGRPGYADGPGSEARFKLPMGLALDPPRRRLLVADSHNHRVRAVDLSTGWVSTLAGSGYGAQDGPGATARFPYPSGVAAAPDGRVFVASGDLSIRVILPDAASTVVTLAGGGQGYADGPGTAARFAPIGVAWADPDLIVADTANLRVRAVSPGADAATTTVRTLAGSGRSGLLDGPGDGAEFGLPISVAVSAGGTIYVADAAPGAIRVIRR